MSHVRETTLISFVTLSPLKNLSIMPLAVFLFHGMALCSLILRVVTLTRTYLLPPYSKDTTLIGKNLLPLGANSFLYEYIVDPFEKEFPSQETRFFSARGTTL